MIVRFTSSLFKNILRIRPPEFYTKHLFSTTRNGDDFISEEPDELDRYSSVI